MALKRKKAKRTLTLETEKYHKASIFKTVWYWPVEWKSGSRSRLTRAQKLTGDRSAIKLEGKKMTYFINGKINLNL